MSGTADRRRLDGEFFRYLLRGALPAEPDAVPYDHLPTAAALHRALRKGSDACALDGLPRQLLAALPWSALRLLAELARPDAPPTPDDLLWTVLLLPLRKKEPSWLLHNSRPILLEPPLLRALATTHFRELMAVLEDRNLIPDELLAYRRGISVAHGVILLRWLLTWWTREHDVCPGSALPLSPARLFLPTVQSR